jgi:hypothetical protein
MKLDSSGSMPKLDATTAIQRGSSLPAEMSQQSNINVHQKYQRIKNPSRLGVHVLAPPLHVVHSSQLHQDKAIFS